MWCGGGAGTCGVGKFVANIDIGLVAPRGFVVCDVTIGVLVIRIVRIVGFGNFL